jgi:hypothetical protein
VSGHTPGPWNVTLLFDGDIRIKNIDNGLNQNNLMREATARLIAAAPDLLDALKMALEAPDDDRSWEDYAIAAVKAADPLWADPLVN